MRALVTVLVFVLTAPTLAAADPPADDAAARIGAATRAALTLAPELAAAKAAGEALTAVAAAQGASGLPYAEIQQEGLGSGLSKRPNSQSTVRFGMPFNLPWQASAARGLRDAAAVAVEAELTVARLDVAEQAAALWLELAAAEARLVIATRARERLDRALALHEERYTLGEVAGFDVVQLDLEQVRSVAAESRAVSSRESLLAAMRRVAGAAAPTPVAEDLEELVAATASPAPDSIHPGDMDRAPRVAVAAEHAARFAARRDLVDVTAGGRPTAEAEWERVPTMDGIPGFDAFGLRISVPLPFGRAVREPRVEAEAAARAAAAEVELVRRRLAEVVDSNLAAAAGAERRLTALGPVLDRLDVAEHSLAEQFRLGAQSYLVYLDGMARFDDVRLTAVEARIELLRARLHLAAALARPDLFPIPDPGDRRR